MCMVQLKSKRTTAHFVRMSFEERQDKRWKLCACGGTDTDTKVVTVVVNILENNRLIRDLMFSLVQLKFGCNIRAWRYWHHRRFHEEIGLEFRLRIPADMGWFEFEKDLRALWGRTCSHTAGFLINCVHDEFQSS